MGTGTGLGGGSLRVFVPGANASAIRTIRLCDFCGELPVDPGSNDCGSIGAISGAENMTFIWVVLWVIALLLGLFILGWMNAVRASIARKRELDNLVRPAIDAVRQCLATAEDMVTKVAEIPVARNHLFARLAQIGRIDIFPASYRTLDKVAESDLARWLMHRNELGSAPAQMELIRKITVRGEGKDGTVYLFRFRADPSNWAAGRGWMAGVAGPYWDGDELPSYASGTFSELTPFDKLTVEQHVDFLRAALKKKGLIVHC